MQSHPLRRTCVNHVYDEFCMLLFCSPVLVEFLQQLKCFWCTVETLVKLKTCSFLFKTNNVGMCTVEPLLKDTSEIKVNQDT